MSSNFVFLKGRAGYVKSRSVSNGSTVTSFSLGVSRGKRKFYIQVEGWDLPESVVTGLQQAEKDKSFVTVQGALDEDSWEKDGQRVRKSKIAVQSSGINVLEETEEEQAQARERAGGGQASQGQARPQAKQNVPDLEEDLEEDVPF